MEYSCTTWMVLAWAGLLFSAYYRWLKKPSALCNTCRDCEFFMAHNGYTDGLCGKSPSMISIYDPFDEMDTDNAGFNVEAEFGCNQWEEKT